MKKILTFFSLFFAFAVAFIFNSIFGGGAQKGRIYTGSLLQNAHADTCATTFDEGTSQICGNGWCDSHGNPCGSVSIGSCGSASCSGGGGGGG